MDYDILIGIHSYASIPDGKPRSEVLRDRALGALDAANRYDSIGAEVGVVFLGGLVQDDVSNAQALLDVAEENVPELVEEFGTIVEARGLNTTEEMSVLVDVTNSLESPPELVVSVSSRDHVPRIAHLWNDYRDAIDAGITVYPSDSTYAASEKAPFILEAAAFEPFVDAFNGVFSIPEESFNDAAAEVADVLEDYAE